MNLDAANNDAPVVVAFYELEQLRSERDPYLARIAAAPVTYRAYVPDKTE